MPTEQEANSMRHQRHKALAIALISSTLAACGGGGSSSKSTPVVVNEDVEQSAPTPNTDASPGVINTEQDAYIGTWVITDGSCVTKLTLDNNGQVTTSDNAGYVATGTYSIDYLGNGVNDVFIQEQTSEGADCDGDEYYPSDYHLYAQVVDGLLDLYEDAELTQPVALDVPTPDGPAPAFVELDPYEDTAIEPEPEVEQQPEWPSSNAYDWSALYGVWIDDNNGQCRSTLTISSDGTFSVSDETGYRRNGTYAEISPHDGVYSSVFFSLPDGSGINCEGEPFNFFPQLVTFMLVGGTLQSYSDDDMSEIIGTYTRAQ